MGLNPGAPFFLVLQKTGTNELLIYQSENLDIEGIRLASSRAKCSSCYPRDLYQTINMVIGMPSAVASFTTSLSLKE